VHFVFFIYASNNSEHHTQFFTSTIFEWEHLLKAVHLEKKNLIFDNMQNPYIKITLTKADQST